MIRESGSAARAIWGDAMILNEKTLIEDLLARPPDALDIFGGHRPIGIVEINPETHATSHLAKFINVTLYGFTTLIVKSCDSKFFDIAFSREAELFFYRNFNGEAVAIPTCLTDYLMTLHRLIAREEIFKYTCFDVMCAWLAIGSRWALVESPARCAITRGDALSED